MPDKNWQFELEEYIRQGEPDRAEKSEAWQTAIGLQAVGGLNTSEYLLDTAKDHIEGKITIDEAQKRIYSYYEHDFLPNSCHGTGDIYASAFAGALVRGKDAYTAAKIAADYAVECIKATAEEENHWYGAKFEPMLPYLITEINKPNDIFVSTLLDPQFSAADLVVHGINSTNTQLLSPEEYKTSEFVKKQFTDETGKFNNDLFTKAYLAAAHKYEEITSIKVMEDLHKYAKYDQDDIFTPLLGEKENKPFGLF